MSFMFNPFPYDDPSAVNRIDASGIDTSSAAVGNDAVAASLAGIIRKGGVIALDGYTTAPFETVLSLAGDVQKIAVSSILKSPAELRPLLKGYEGRVCTIDAGKISEEELGKNFPNTPMLAAIVKVSGVVEPDAFVKDMEASFKHKFASKPQVIEGNMRALKRSMEEVQVG